MTMNDKLSLLLTGRYAPGLYRLVSHTTTEHLCAEADRANWLCYQVDGAAVSDKATLLTTFATALHFPSYYGHNWDAFEECLRDLSWERVEDAKGILIIYNDVDRFAKKHPKDWTTASGILKAVIAFWHEVNRPMIVLLRGDTTSAVEVPEL